MALREEVRLVLETPTWKAVHYFATDDVVRVERQGCIHFRLLCWIRGHDQVIARPGRGGHMPPRSSMARATRASGERNPKAMRARSRSFVFTLSTRAFDSPWLSAALMPARCSRMERASLTNAGSRQRQAHFSQASSSAIPAAPLS